jgi:hypothetical protein
VTLEAPAVGDLGSREPQRAPGHQAVDVEALPDADAAHARTVP